MGPGLVLTLPEARLPSSGTPHLSSSTRVPDRLSTGGQVSLLSAWLSPPPHTQPKHGKKDLPLMPPASPRLPREGITASALSYVHLQTLETSGSSAHRPGSQERAPGQTVRVWSAVAGFVIEGPGCSGTDCGV